MHFSKAWRVALAVWMVVFSFAVGLTINQNRDLIHNHDTLIVHLKRNDQIIQQSRIFSCRQTYQNIRNAFRELFPPKKLRTPKQQNNIDIFLRNTDPNQCSLQVKSLGGANDGP